MNLPVLRRNHFNYVSNVVSFIVKLYWWNFTFQAWIQLWKRWNWLFARLIFFLWMVGLILFWTKPTLNICLRQRLICMHCKGGLIGICWGARSCQLTTWLHFTGNGIACNIMSVISFGWAAILQPCNPVNHLCAILGGALWSGWGLYALGEAGGVDRGSGGDVCLCHYQRLRNSTRVESTSPPLAADHHIAAISPPLTCYSSSLPQSSLLVPK